MILGPVSKGRRVSRGGLQEVGKDPAQTQTTTTTLYFSRVRPASPLEFVSSKEFEDFTPHRAESVFITEPSKAFSWPLPRRDRLKYGVNQILRD